VTTAFVPSASSGLTSSSIRNSGNSPSRSFNRSSSRVGTVEDEFRARELDPRRHLAAAGGVAVGVDVDSHHLARSGAVSGRRVREQLQPLSLGRVESRHVRTHVCAAGS